jgi:hypothetical protein
MNLTTSTDSRELLDRVCELFIIGIVSREGVVDAVLHQSEEVALRGLSACGQDAVFPLLRFLERLGRGMILTASRRMGGP